MGQWDLWFAWRSKYYIKQGRVDALVSKGC